MAEIERKHNSSDLIQMQSLPLEAKISMTKRRIREWYDHHDGMVYVSFSGGKDSTVLKHIVDSMYKDVPAVFVNTGLEYPEIQRFVNRIKRGEYSFFNSDVSILIPDMRFDEVISTYGYPIISKDVSKAIKDYRNPNISDNYRNVLKSRFDGNRTFNGKPSMYNCSKWKPMLDAPFLISNKCCDVMKKAPAHKYGKTTGRKPLIATMASESLLRRKQWLTHGCNAYEGTNPSSKPMSFWTEQDVLHYIKKFNVPYAEVYGDIVPVSDNAQIDGQISMFEVEGDYSYTKLTTTGANRTGCIFCGYGCHLEKYPNRFQRLQQTHPRQYEYCIGGGEFDENGLWKPNKQGLGLARVLDYLGVKYEQEEQNE